MRAAIIHIIGDMVQSIGVITAAVIIKVKPEWQIADPICTYLFSILVLMTTVPIFKDCIGMLMEASPSDIDTTDLYDQIRKLEVVQEIKDFHCWALSGGKYIMSCQIISNNGNKAIREINNICR